ncbi:MAG: flagellar hook-length control protein FliK [Fibromonadaceae bacterium]|jgi:hypothetical protein|nr:flagellar hook-length control protein FliK [Fibromonadaceae bacterium]
MHHISTIPAPVAAQASGFGSFFGSCQMAAGNFEAVFQSASASMGNGADTARAQALGQEELKLFSEFMENCDKNKVLANLQEILGEEAGAEAFELAVKVAENGKFISQLNPECQIEIHNLKRLFSMAENGFCDEAGLKEFMGNCIKKIESMLVDMKIEEPPFAKMSLEDFKNMNLLATEMGIKPEDKGKFEDLISSLLESGLITSQDLAEAVKVIPQEFAEGMGWSVGEKELEAAKEIESTPIRDALEGIWSMVKDEKEIKVADLPQKLEKVKHFKHEGSRHAAMHKLGRFQPHKHLQLRKVPSVKLQFSDINVNISALAESHASKEPERLALVSIDVPEDKSYFFFIKIDQKTGEGSLWLSDKPLLADKEIAKANLNDNLNPMQMEDTPVKRILEDILENLQQKFAKFINQMNSKPEHNLGMQEFSQEFSQEIEQEIEQDETLQMLFLLLKKVKNNEALTKNEKAELAAIIDSRFDFRKNEEPEGDRELSLAEGEKKTIPRENIGDSEKDKEIDIAKYLLNQEATRKSKGMKIASLQAHQIVAPQPEVRAVWEGGDLKIETINPKTGEKTQTISTRMQHSMQERIHEFEVVRQVVAQAKLITTPTGEQRMTIQLKPQHLGQVDLRISLSNSEMQIQARVESPIARAALETHIGLLREGLEKQGISLDRLEVSVEQRDKQDAFSLAERQDREEQRQSSHKHRRGREQHLAVSVAAKDPNADTGRRHGYNTMEYLA